VPDLRLIASALSLAGTGARHANRRQQQSDKNYDHRDHHQQFDERKRWAEPLVSTCERNVCAVHSRAKGPSMQGN